MRPDIEQMAEAVHEAYLTTCKRLGWPVKPSNAVPYAELSEDSKELDRASVRVVVAHLEAAGSAQGVVFEAWSDDGCELWSSHGLFANRADAQEALGRAKAEETDEGVVFSIRERPVIGAAPPSPAPAALRWTREKPSDLGIYLFRDIGDENPTRWLVFRVSRDMIWTSHEHMEHAGPIPEPSGTPSETPEKGGAA